MDADFAAETTFGERVVNGLYTVSLAAGLAIPETTDGTIVDNLGYDGVEHPEPVFHGDTLRAEATILDTRLTSDGDRGVVTMQVDVYGGADTPVCAFERTAMVDAPKDDAAVQRPSNSTPLIQTATTHGMASPSGIVGA